MTSFVFQSVSLKKRDKGVSKKINLKANLEINKFIIKVQTHLFRCGILKSVNYVHIGID